nr:transposase [Clostridium beijerinckii]
MQCRHLADNILNFNEESRVILQATGTYHLPVLSYLKQRGIFVEVINPVIMCQETWLK